MGKTSGKQTNKPNDKDIVKSGENPKETMLKGNDQKCKGNLYYTHTKISGVSAAKGLSYLTKLT